MSRIAELAAAYRDGTSDPVSETEKYLARIEHCNTKLNAFTAITRERAIREAEQAREELRQGQDRGLLHGVPYAVKEHFDVANVATMVGCSLLNKNIASEDCTAVTRLRDAGMVLLGKTQTVQFGGGIVGINQDVGTPHNPWHEIHHVPGGSSSGSGVAVAAGLAPIALGGDTGGSVRAPASLCGTVGLKTTLGRISRDGVYPMSQTLDTVGVLSQCVQDAALAYDLLQGPDQNDETTVSVTAEPCANSLNDDISGMRLAVPTNTSFEGCEPAVETAVRNAIAQLRNLGTEIVELEIPELTEVHHMEYRYAVSGCETYANNEDLFQEHAEQLDPLLGWVTDVADLPASIYLRILQQHKKLCRRIDTTLAGFDAVITPTTLSPALPLASVAPNLGSYTEKYHLNDPSEHYGRNTSMMNFLGLCGISLPCGFTPEGLPIGLQICGKAFDELTILRLAQAFESNTEWHLRDPDLSWV